MLTAAQCFIQTHKHWEKWRLLGETANEARMAENRGRRPTAGVGFFGRGNKSPTHQLGTLGERGELHQRPPKGFSLFSALGMASPDTMILLIVDHKKKTENSYPIQSWVNYCAFGDAVWYFQYMRLNSQLESRKRRSSLQRRGEVIGGDSTLWGNSSQETSR